MLHSTLTSTPILSQTLSMHLPRRFQPTILTPPFSPIPIYSTHSHLLKTFPGKLSLENISMIL